MGLSATQPPAGWVDYGVVAGREDDPNLIDLTGFTDPEESLRRASTGLDQYSEIAKHHLQGATLITLAHHAVIGFISRARGLHEGTEREIRNANPHAVGAGNK